MIVCIIAHTLQISTFLKMTYVKNEKLTKELTRISSAPLRNPESGWSSASVWRLPYECTSYLERNMENMRLSFKYQIKPEKHFQSYDVAKKN